MAIVDMTNWEFSFGANHPTRAATPSSLQNLAFQTTLDLLLHLAGDETRLPVIQRDIDKRLRADPVVKTWHRNRAYLKDMSHFPKYKGRHYDKYHLAARAVAAESSTSKQQAMTTGLNQEIAVSKIMAPKGQIVLHGRSDLLLHSCPSYSSFISTSLDPVVAVNSALRRGGLNQINGRPVVYILTLRDPLSVIWGNGGKPHEWELLMETNLSCVHTTTHFGTRFDIVEATIGN